MTRQSEHEIDQVLAPVAADYLPEEQAAAAEEAREAAASALFSLRLRPDVHEAVRIAATRQHTTPSALIRRWVTERVESTDSVDLPAAVAAVQRDVETIAALVIPVPRDR